MKGIKFLSEDSHEKMFAKALRKRVRAYFKDNNISMKGNSSMYLKTVVMLAIYFIPFVLILTIPLPAWAALVLVVIIGVGSAGIGMSVMHDGAHGAYSSKKWVNNLAASSMFLLGSNTFNWKVQHNVKHHTFTNMYDFDPDISTKAVIRLSEHAPLKKYHRFQHLYSFLLYGLMTLTRFFGEMSTLLRHNKEGVTIEQKAKPTLEVLKLAATKILYLSIIFGLPLWLTDYNLWQIALGFIIMQLTAGMIMTIVFQMAHVVEGTYQPLPDDQNTFHTDWLVHQLKATADFGRKNGILSYYIGGLDYQVEHHLFPYICHIHYPAISSIVEETAKEFGYQYNLKSNIKEAFMSHFRRLKELGTKVTVPAF